MLKIAICDEDIKCTSKMKKIIERTACENGNEIEIDVCFGGSVLIKNNKRVPYDVIFLDVEMEKMNGLEIAKLIRKSNELVYLIFVSSHSEYAIAAYEVQPFRFIVKPIEEELVKTCFLKAYAKISNVLSYFEYKFNLNYSRNTSINY